MTKRPERYTNDKSFNGKDFRIKILIHQGNILHDRKQRGKGMITVYLNSLSKEFYKYALSFSEQIETGDNPFTEPVKVYSNIENGLGVFAGYSYSKDSLVVVW